MRRQPPFPAGFDARPAPLGISFTGGACSEPRLIEIAYAFEQASKRRVRTARLSVGCSWVLTPYSRGGQTPLTGSESRMKKVAVFLLLGPSSSWRNQRRPPGQRAAFLKLIDRPRVDPAPVVRPMTATGPGLVQEHISLSVDTAQRVIGIARQTRRLEGPPSCRDSVARHRGTQRAAVAAPEYAGQPGVHGHRHRWPVSRRARGRRRKPLDAVSSAILKAYKTRASVRFSTTRFST